MDSFVPRLQLNSSRTSGGEERLGATSRLNQTAAPHNASALSGGEYNTRNGGFNNNNNHTTTNYSSSSNNNTSMTNNTMNSDAYNNGDGGYGAGAAPPSPAPRFGERYNFSSEKDNGTTKENATSFSHGWPNQQYADPAEGRSAFFYHTNNYVNGAGAATSDTGSRSAPGPSTMRPLFTSESASNPRDANVLVGDTSRVPVWGRGAASSKPAGLGLDAHDDYLNRYRTDSLFGRETAPLNSNFESRGYGGPQREVGATTSVFGSTRAPANTFTSTYVGTSTGFRPESKPSYGMDRGSGVGVSDFDWRGGTRSLVSDARSKAALNTDRGYRNSILRDIWTERPHDSDDGSSVDYDRADSRRRHGYASGLVNSRSRARADRWTDDNTNSDDGPARAAFSRRDDDGAGGADDRTVSDYDGMTSLDEVAPPPTEESASSQQRRGERHRHRGHANARGVDGSNDGDENSSSEDSDDLWEDEDGDADPLSFADAVVRAMDAQPVVPLEMLRRAQETPFIWIRHPSHGIVLSLLQHRGIYLPRYRELVDYHMAELFLHYIDLCREGAFFVYYAPSKWPKERFFRIRMLPVNRLEAATEPVPHLVITLHESGVHILDAIPLDNLVGVTISPQAACFRPFLESPNTIIGCREGRGHRTRMPIDGAFSLWFYDVRQRTSRSVDILTCDAKVFDIWTKTFRGLVSVNSSSVVQVAMTPQGESAELAGLTQAAREQSEIDHGERKGKYAED